jgi:hypothetical protein
MEAKRNSNLTNFYTQKPADNIIATVYSDGMGLVLLEFMLCKSLITSESFTGAMIPCMMPSYRALRKV